MNSKLLRKPCDRSDMFALLRDGLFECKDESNRGLVLTTFSALEIILANLLWQRINEPAMKPKDFKNSLFGGQGIVSTASASTNVCFAFGVIDEENFEKLNALRAIRNIAAHKISFRFEEADSKGLLAPFEHDLPFTPKGAKLVITNPEGGESAEVSIRGPIGKEKLAYLVLVNTVGTYLLNQILESPASAEPKG